MPPIKRSIFTRLQPDDKKKYYYHCSSLTFIVLLHIPIIPMALFIKDWGKSHDTSFHHFLDNSEGHYGSWYLKPMMGYLAHVGCEITRYLNMMCSKSEYSMVNRLDQCHDASPGFFYWDSMWYRPDDSDTIQTANYFLLVGWQHQLLSIILFIFLFFNFFFLFVLILPGFNWIIYGVAIALNAVLQCWLYAQYTVLIGLGWGTWLVVVPVCAALILYWLLFQWYGKFAILCQFLCPGIILSVWLLPLNVALTAGALEKNHADQVFPLVAAYLFSAVAVVLKPTVILFGVIAFRIYKESQGSSRVEPVTTAARTIDRLTTLEKAVYAFKSLF